jgi:hypothetical protein
MTLMKKFGLAVLATIVLVGASVALAEILKLRCFIEARLG